MNNYQTIKEIFNKIAETGIVEDSHNQIINRAINSDEKMSFQFGEKIINIGKAEGIHIGDRIYYEWNDHKQRDIFIKANKDYKTFSEYIGWKKRAFLGIHFFSWIS